MLDFIENERIITKIDNNQKININKKKIKITGTRKLNVNK